jgi:uncharacterized tellurite resistance protein B-like protein
MIKTLGELIRNALTGASPENSGNGGPTTVELAAAVLMVEISMSDAAPTECEREVIEQALCREFHLPPAEAREVIEAAEKEANHAVCLHEYVRLINASMPLEQRVKIVELLWRVAFADAVLDKHEEYQVRRIADLLYVPHASLVRTRHRASGKDD